MAGLECRSRPQQAGLCLGHGPRGHEYRLLRPQLTAPDMLKIGQLYLDDGRWQGRQLVSPQWVKDSTSNQLSNDQQSATDGPYGYFWWIGDIQSHPYFAAFGSYGQQIIVVPDSGLVVVTVCDESGFDSPTEEFRSTFDDIIFTPILQA